MIKLYFSDFFEIDERKLEKHGAFNVSLLTDLPLFIDPFLLFSSEKREYQQLHKEIILYLQFLKAKSENTTVDDALLKAWYCFTEVKQNWLGFCKNGNSGRGLGNDFAKSLNENLVLVFKDFGEEKITKSSHLEKLCLIKGGVGKDMISDFSTNLIKHFLLEYTQTFTLKNIKPEFQKQFSVNRTIFNYSLERWMPKSFILPFYQDDFVLLTPKDILTKDDTWINHSDMISKFHDIPDSISNSTLRAQVNNYFESRLPDDRKPTIEDREKAALDTINKYPMILDYYIKHKEDNGEDAISLSNIKVLESQALYIKQFSQLVTILNSQTQFYLIKETTKEETKKKIDFFKDVIENKGGHKIFYVDNKPIRRESDVHILFRLTWHITISDISREVNDGRGPVDFKISRGAHDKTLVEFKLASNPQLKRNLEKQLEIYKKASDTEIGFKVIIYFSENEYDKVIKILKELNIINDLNIVLIDARIDNKPSASKA
jgi:hypothetical protein